MKKKETQENNQHMDTESSVNINTDENIDGSQLLNDPIVNESEVESLRLEVEDLKDRNLRLAAEFDNYKRRTAKERVELLQTAGRDVITDLLDTLDDCERAEKQMESTEDIALIKEGIQLVFTKFRNGLSAKGLKQMEVVGKDFNPDFHEAISEIDAGAEMHGKVIAEVQKGYLLNDKIIRFAKVVVGK